MTGDAALKFKLFRSRLIDKGDEVKIRGTKAKLIALESYYNRGAGFRETVKVMLAFGEQTDLMRSGVAVSTSQASLFLCH